MQQLASRATFAVRVARRLVFSKDRPSRDDAAWLCRELAARGPVLIKIGQFVSSRGDLFDPVLVDALRTLQDRVPPMPPEDLARALRDCPAISSYDPTPVASASIGQVHTGTLADGRVIAIKVRRPDIVSQVGRELDALGSGISFLDLLSHFSSDPEAAVSAQATRRLLTDFQEVMLMECDYESEVANMALFHSLEHRATSRSRSWVSPRVFPELCSASRIVMEYLPSVRMDEVMPHLCAGDRSDLAEQLMDLVVSHMLVDQLVHSDLQPGNVGIDADGRIVLYDFGNVIRLPPGLVRSLEGMLIPLLDGDLDAMMGLLREVDVINIRDEAGLRRYVELFMEYVRCADLGALSLEAVDLSALRSSKLPVEIDGVIFRLLRALALAEGLCKSIDPCFTYVGVARRYSTQLDADRVFRARAKADLRRLLAAAARLVEGW